MEQLNASEIMQKLNSPQGQKLLLLMKKDGGAAFTEAAAAVKNGNYQLARSIMEKLLAGTNAEQLARSLEDNNG